MAATSRSERTTDEVRAELADERQQLAESVEALREELGAATRSKLPLVAAGALGVGFVVAGGIGATARLLVRRGREK